MTDKTEQPQTEQIKARSLEIAFDEHSWRRVQEIKRKAGLEGKPDVLMLRNAMMLYEWFLSETASGGEIAIVRNGRVQKHQIKFD